MKIKLPELPELVAVRKIIRRINEAGYAAALVGGVVRDLVMGRKPHDFDVMTTMPPDRMPEFFDSCRMVGASFGVALIRIDGFEFEVATARKERNYMDGRHPGDVRYTDDPGEDVLRRDFTINAMLCNPFTGEIDDRVGGLADLSRGVVRTVGRPAERFREDYLRMLRAVRFAARFGFEIDPETRRALVELAPLAARISGERIRLELEAILLGPRPAAGFRMLQEFGLLAAVLPEVAAQRGVAQPPEFHPEGDVFEHTMLMLEHLAYPDPITAWSVLLHDVGKPGTFRVSGTEGGRIRFFGHEELGADLVAEIGDRLRFSAADRDAVAEVVRGHMRMAAVREMRPAKLRRLLGGTYFSSELELHRVDCLSCHGKMEGFVFLLDRLREYDSSATGVLPEPWVRGRDLVAAGLRPGPDFRPVLDWIYDRQLGGELADRGAALRLAVAECRRRSGDAAGTGRD